MKPINFKSDFVTDAISGTAGGAFIGASLGMIGCIIGGILGGIITGFASIKSNKLREEKNAQSAEHPRYCSAFNIHARPYDDRFSNEPHSYPQREIRPQNQDCH